MLSAYRAIHAEWTKLRTVQSTGWLLLIAFAGTVALGFAITGSLDFQHCDEPCTIDTTKLSLAGVRLGQVGIVVLSVLAVTGEYSTRTIQPTLTAVPARLLVVLGKVVVSCVLVLAAAIPAVAASLLAAGSVLPGNGFTVARGFAELSLENDLVRRAAVGSVLYLALIAVLGTGIGLLLRDTAGAVATMLGLLYGAPIVGAFVTDPVWQHRIHRFSPMDAGLAIQSTRNLAAEHIGPWAGIGVLSAYAAVALVAGMIVFLLRDAG